MAISCNQDGKISLTTIADGVNANETTLINHEADETNPHVVTAGQIGAATSSHTHSTYNRSVSDLAGATVFDRITVADGIVTSIDTRELTAANIGAATSSHTHSTYDRSSSDLAGATVFDRITVTDGITTSVATRELTANDINALPLSGSGNKPYMAKEESNGELTLGYYDNGWKNTLKLRDDSITYVGSDGITAHRLSYVSSGENSNGIWILLDRHTLICFYRLIYDGPVNLVGSLYAAPSALWTYPADFKFSPAVSASSDNIQVWFAIDVTTNSSALIKPWSPVGGKPTGVLSICAIGEPV